ncbi:MAG: hypothetical protein LC114_02925 [Bryobacterales bacterium]|nr:hypothetical protein [Bryobacterales bacterium]
MRGLRTSVPFLQPENPYPDLDPERDPSDWPRSYFNYFTEIEEHFQQVRGTALFLLSPLDWSLIEVWKNSGIPLEAVLRGIDSSFEKWRSRKQQPRQINSLAYCSQAVLLEARRMLDQQAGTEEGTPPPSRTPFTRDALVRFLQSNAVALTGSNVEDCRTIGGSLSELAADAAAAPEDLSGFDTEDLERKLSVLEDKMLALLRLAQSDDDLASMRRELDAQLRPYRSKMTAEQLRQLEEQYLSRKLLEKAGLPRLSLFYMTDYGT